MISALASLLLAGAEMKPQSLAGASDTKPIQVKFDPKAWKLVWGDEFDKDGLPDSTKWDYEEGYIRNNEAQYYTRARKENARIEGGKLIIEARMDNWNGHKITSANLVTRNKQHFTYGRIEIRAKVPTGRGTWPAFWTLGENIGEVGWPKCGEIDILEYVGFDPDKVHANVHCDAYNHMKGNGRGNNLPGQEPWKEFNVYAVEWWPDRLEFFFNETRYLVYRKEADNTSVWPFDQPHFLLLNLAIGGAWGGVKGIDESLFPHKFEVDYVRVYRRVRQQE